MNDGLPLPPSEPQAERSHAPAMEVTGQVPAPEITLGWQLGEVFRLLARHFAPATGIVLLLALPGAAACSFFPKLEPAESLFGLVTLMIPGAVLFLVDARENGRELSVTGAIGMAFERWGVLFGVLFLKGIFVALWSVLCLVPGIVKSLAWTIALPIRLFEPEATPNAMRALEASAERTRGHKGMLFVVGFVIGIASMGGVAASLGGQFLRRGSLLPQPRTPSRENFDPDRGFGPSSEVVEPEPTLASASLALVGRLGIQWAEIL